MVWKAIDNKEIRFNGKNYKEKEQRVVILSSQCITSSWKPTISQQYIPGKMIKCMSEKTYLWQSTDYKSVFDVSLRLWWLSYGLKGNYFRYCENDKLRLIKNLIEMSKYARLIRI